MIVWLNADQVAERLSVSRRTALTLMYQMPHSVIGGSVRKRIRVSEGSLDAWMVKQSNKLPITDTMQTGSRRKLKRR
jgi:hypothetical protein